MTYTCLSLESAFKAAFHFFYRIFSLFHPQICCLTIQLDRFDFASSAKFIFHLQTPTAA